MDLRAKTAVVTGAAKRLGREIAMALASRGANVAVHYHTSAAEAHKVLAEIKRFGVESLAVGADQSKAVEVRRAVKTIARRFGAIDVLVNCAAVFRRTPWATLSERDWDYHLDANLKGPFLFALETARHMRRGHIVNIADWAVWRPYRNYLPYVVSKAGLVGLTKALAKELAPNIQVNAVAPGPVLLPPDFPDSAKEKIRNATLLKRLGSPSDVVNAVLYLLEGGDFVTGQVLVVDGGRLLAGE
ncbi:MAG: SDR family oxidoreductase [Verrucomicrobiae bacterium]|nr:SDR family oxidoreductase [Verrucomicrobiae bacterium]